MNLFKEVSVQGDAITARASHRTVVFKKRLYVVMGRAANVFGDVYWTDDCQRWHKQSALSDTDGNAIPPVYSFGLCVHNEKVYLMGGRNIANTKYDHVYVTSDMVHWKKLQNAAWAARSSFVALSFDNKIWVISGSNAVAYLNDVWWSVDGVNWKQEPNAPWTGRYGTGLVHNNKIYVIAGYGGSNLNDVWSTQNGRDWVQVSSAAEFSARRYLAVTQLGDRIVLVSGYDTSRQSDLWHSVDGRIWKLASDTIAPGGLSGHSVNYFNNRLVVACGSDGSNYRNNVFIGTDKLLRIK